MFEKPQIVIEPKLEHEQGGQVVVPQTAQLDQSVQAVATPMVDQVTQGPRRSGRTWHEPVRYYCFLMTQCEELLLVEDGEPPSYLDAMSSPDSERWQEAIRSEMDSMYVDKVWALVDPPLKVETLGCW